MLRSVKGRVNSSTDTPGDWGLMGEQADTLTGILATRLQRLIADRLPTRVNVDHWAIVWFEGNLGRLAAVIYLQGHIRADIRCARASDALLADGSRFMVISDSGDATPGTGRLEGAYLHYHPMLHRFVRAGKAVRTGGFARRQKEHSDASRLLTQSNLDSNFYTTYPLRSAKNASNAKRRGYFEDLVLCVAAGFDRGDKVALRHLTSGEQHEMILELKHWCASCASWIHPLTFSVHTTHSGTLLSATINDACTGSTAL